eukprot:TRINITY_DN7933_c2_g1_i1.p1 TRINITY_DN7933_c2_g1~~TRINITY_DN7933_c2_g1_i1.p1  ORF type:complete len:424 (+),score=127.17 TRINITY_DN7933_c2_g1_i1:70-1341(+)
MHTLDEQSAKNVGYAFIKEYYGRFRSNPMELCDMYSKDSRFVRRNSDARSQPINAYGVNEIKMHLAKLPRSKFQLSYVVCHPSVHGSILIRVEGTWLTEDGTKEFHQTFVLTPNANSQQCFYIYNDLTSIIEEGPAAPPAPPSPPAAPVQTFVQPAVVQPPAPVAVMKPVAPTPETATVVEQLESVISADKINTVTAEQVESDLQNQVEEVIAEPEEDIPQAPEEAPEEEEKPDEEVDEQVEEEPEEDTTGKTLSYADMVAKKNKEPVKRTQVVSGGKMPNAPEKKVADAGGKRGVDRDLIGTLNLISSVKQSGKGKGGKGASGGKGAGNRGEKHSLYVKNIPKSFSEADAEKLFTTFGKISGKTIKAQDGYAFIDFDSREALDSALAKPSLAFKGTTLSLQERKGGNQRKENGDNRPRSRKQ